jgi:cytoskeletal protein CcmA (bactofilin family)
VNEAFGIQNEAIGINGSLNPSGATLKVTGDLHVTGSVSLPAGSSVSGNVYATALTAQGTIGQAFVQEPAGGAIVAPSTVTDYRTYTLNGVTYSATNLTTDPTAGKVLGPTVSNPAGIYYTMNRNVNLAGVTINGSLIVKSGNLNITSGNANVITPMANFPGLVVDKQIIAVGSGKALTVNGLTWAGTGINGSGSNSGSSITINGSLLIPNSTGINSYNGTLNLNYNATNANVPTFSSQMQQPTSMKVLSWSD